MVVLDPRTREVLALVGGYGYKPGGFDRAQRALRQAGSAFKPFVYAAAIDTGRYTAATIVNDAPEVYDLWKPQNYERSFRGPVSLRFALAESINTVAIKLLSDVGIPAVKDMAVRAGLKTPLPDDIGLAMALGASSVTPLELANAYATLATGGMRDDPRFVTKIGDEAVAAANPQSAMRPETAYVVTSMMRSVIDVGTARAALRLKRPAAGKTGTSNDKKDAWFVAFTPDLLAAVWVGFDDGRSLGSGEAGGKTALPIWVDFMTKALADRPVKDFPQPPGITVARIDPKTGLLASGGEGTEEVFLSGTEPKEAAPAQDEPVNADQVLLGTPSQ
jgi:penicillin-binding protein 1A